MADLEYSAEHIEILKGVAGVRRRPSMYVGDVEGDGLLNLVLDAVASACDRHVAGQRATVGVEIAADGTVTIEDDGHGLTLLRAHGGELDDEIMEVRGGVAPDPLRIASGGIGLAVLNALSERLEIATAHDGIEWRGVYSRGERIAPLARTSTPRQTGTTVRFRPDAAIFRTTRVSRGALTARLEELSFLVPQATLRWSFAGDGFATAGMAGRVASIATCSLAEVAHHRGTYGTLFVEVALAWRAGSQSAAIESFVNFARAPEHGEHTCALHDGIRRFLGIDKQAIAYRDGLVASIAILNQDVNYRLQIMSRQTYEMFRAPIAEATHAALTRWAATHVDAVAALRAR